MTFFVSASSQGGLFSHQKCSRISREIEDDVQSATHRQIRPEGVGVARQEETLDAGHGERSSPDHQVGSSAQALCRRRSSFDSWWLVMVGPEKAQAEHAQSVIVGLDRLSKRTEHVADLIAVCAHNWVYKYASAQNKQLCDFSVALVDRSTEGRDLLVRVPAPCLVHIDALLGQQHGHHLRVATPTRNEKWRPTIIHGLVHIDALLGQQHRHHLRVALSTRSIKWRATIIRGLVHIDALLGQQQRHHLLVPCGLRITGALWIHSAIQPCIHSCNTTEQ